MAEHIRVSQISKYVGQEVTVKGWIYNRTDKGPEKSGSGMAMANKMHPCMGWFAYSK